MHKPGGVMLRREEGPQRARQFSEYIERHARVAVGRVFFTKRHAVHKRSCTMNSRVFLVVAPCLVILGGCRAANAPNSTEPSFTLKEVAPHVWAAMSNAKSSAPAPANTGFVIGDDGVAVVDASMSIDAEGNLGTDTARQ